MLRNDKYQLLWSDWFDEQCCENIYDDDCHNNCGYDGGCSYRCGNGDYDYDFMWDCVKEDLHMRFGKNDYQYFLLGDSCFWYGGYEGNKPNMDIRVSPIYDSIEDLVYSQLGYCDNHRIYKGKYNSLWLEGSHHDGSELYRICRLSKQGQNYYDLDYDFDWYSNCIKSVFKDFKKNF